MTSAHFMKGGEFHYPDSMIFYPFEVNEDKEQQVEHNGELDPGAHYFN